MTTDIKMDTTMWKMMTTKKIMTTKMMMKRKMLMMSNQGDGKTISSVCFAEGLLTAQARRMFGKLEKCDGDATRAFGRTLRRKLYGSVARREGNESDGDGLVVNVEVVEGDDANDIEDDNNACIVGCIDATSAGLDAVLAGDEEEEEIKSLAEEFDVFVFVKMDCLVSAVGLGCRLECYDTKNDFLPVDYEIFGDVDVPPDALFSLQ